MMVEHLTWKMLIIIYTKRGGCFIFCFFFDFVKMSKGKGDRTKQYGNARERR
jgi:hypothetical protein